MKMRTRVDVCVYGGTSGGVVAAVAAARQGRSVVLVEPGRHLGGMTSGGLGLTDTKGTETVGGLAGAFYGRIGAQYRASGPQPNGPAGPAHHAGEGWTHEPHVAEQVLRDWLDEHQVPVLWECRIAGLVKQGARIRTIRLDQAPPDERGAPIATPEEPEYAEIEAAMFIDASYEGDLLAKAGVSYTTDREGKDRYNESLAGIRRSRPRHEIDAFVQPGRPESGLLPLLQPGDGGGPEGAASAAVQAYTFRLCLVQNIGPNQNNWLPIEPPNDYDPARYELFARIVEAEHATEPLTIPGALYHWPPPYREPRLFKISSLPGGKTDVNQLDLVGYSHDYPEGDWATRARVWRAHQDYQRGLLHFFGTSERVPEAVRIEVAKWGLPKDEFKDTGGWPHQLYIRESRRMLGATVMTQRDCEAPAAVLNDAIGMGTYSLDSHVCQRLARGGKVVNEGGFYQRIPGPYPIPYRAITPHASECENLLVIFCLSSSHAAYSSLRMEPVLMILGESAALAACQALEEDRSVQNINVARLTTRLREAGQVLQV